MGMKSEGVVAPTRVETIFNDLMGFLFRRGWAPSYGHELEVRGRKTGKLHHTPVNLLEVDGTLYLVAPRGETQWVKNARASGEVVLTRRNSRTTYRVTEVPVARRPTLLAAYLDRYASQVQRFFDVKAGSSVEAFASIADHHPVFVLEKKLG